jgi:hypothetical protein
LPVIDIARTDMTQAAQGQDNDDDSDLSPGWDAITAALERLYPGQEPKHYATALKWMFGGPDPLDGVSVWKRMEPVPHWHYLSYGLSELYAKESGDADTSGYGFELTFRLACEPDEAEPPAWAINFLQNLARYVFKSGNVFDDGHWMTANGPIALERETLICSMGFVFDPELPAIDTPNGRMRFLQVVGLTEDEERACKRWDTRKLLDALLPAMPLWVTDLARPSLLDDPEVRRRVEEGAARDGSSSGFLFTDVLGWETSKRLLRAPVAEITIGARQVDELIALLPLRLPFGRGFHFASRERALAFEHGETDRVTEEDGKLTLHLSDATVRELARTLKPVAGTYEVPGFGAVRWKVQKTTIRDPQGNVVRTVG